MIVRRLEAPGMPTCRALLCVNTTRGESRQGCPAHPGSARSDCLSQHWIFQIVLQNSPKFLPSQKAYDIVRDEAIDSETNSYKIE